MPLEIGNIGFKIVNVGFKNQKLWDGGSYFVRHNLKYIL